MLKRTALALLLAVCLMLTAIPAVALEAVPPDISAPSAILMEASTGRVLYENSPDERMHPASVTKVMTILLVAEAIDSGRIALTDMVQTSAYAASMGGSQVYLEAGELMSVEDLFKAVVVASGNDAATALAEHIAGSAQGFVALMNQRAGELGMTHTTFANCHGLDEDSHLTTARDIALMSSALLNNHPWVTDYTTIWMDSLRDGAFELANTNKLLRSYKGTIGLKTGSTGKAKFCLASAAERDGMVLVAVVLGAPSTNDRFLSAAKLLDFGFANYKKVQVPVTGLQRIAVLGGTQEDVGIAAVPQEATAVVPKSDNREITAKTYVQEKVTAPVEQGQWVGEIIFSIGDTELSRGKLVTQQAVQRRSVLSQFLHSLELMLKLD